ncbi:cell division protein FtsN [Arthrobacter pascens]|uniref:zinc ribbon domain-containing protein n=1 Tax=Arthrobacter pascens TaxID=1677 RepID=UPI0027928BF2|nr:zinc ribbon domain-containing protein [Arthrobacter pascens]MDQ0679751.1 cell division protein FtsN [Arthrobacter pascens]
MNIPTVNDSSEDNIEPTYGPRRDSRSGPQNSATSDTTAADPEQNPEGPPTKVCPKCSVQNQTIGKFCPNCGAPYNAQRLRAKVNKRVFLIVAAALIVLIAGTGVVLSIQHTNQVNAEQAAAATASEAEKKRESEAAEAEKKRESEAAAAAARATAAKQAADASKRKQRNAIVTALEDSVLKDAQERVTTGRLTGPITLASCTPLGGGSSDDLTAITGTFQCIAVNKTNPDGSSSGYRFSATVNWNDTSYTWHLGS